MTEKTPPRVLIVANRTASTPALLREVERRAATAARFTLLIPPEGSHHAPDWTREDAVRLLERAAGGSVGTVDAGSDAAVTIHRAVADGEYDEVIVSTVVAHHARWLHHDLPRRLTDLRTPVMVIPPEPQQWGPIEGFPSDWVPSAASPAATAGFGNY